MPKEKSAPVLSILVTAFNTEAYLRRCLNSIERQTLKDWECIVVDNGCTDGSGAIMEEFAAKDSRFVVIHKERGTTGTGRNAGLDAARGEYIGFVDSDDWIEPDAYEAAISAARQNDADIVQWRMVREWAEGPIPSEELAEGFFCFLESPEYYAVNLVIKLFKRGLIFENQIRSPEDINMHEDLIFSNMAYAISYAQGKKCFFLNRVLYHVERRRPTSVTKQHKNTPELLAAYAKETREAIEHITRVCARALETGKQGNRETLQAFC